MSQKIRIDSFNLENLDIQKKDNDPTLIMSEMRHDESIAFATDKKYPMRRLWQNLKCETCNS